MAEKKLPEGTLIALDFGLSRIGVARGSTLLREAVPLTIIHAKTKADRWSGLDAVVSEWEPVAFVVGVPRHGDGTPTTITATCEKFARQVAARYCRPSFTVDERYSSVVVESDADYIDDEAAAVILGQYFLEHPSA